MHGDSIEYTRAVMLIKVPSFAARGQMPVGGQGVFEGIGVVEEDGNEEDAEEDGEEDEDEDGYEDREEDVDEDEETV